MKYVSVTELGKWRTFTLVSQCRGDDGFIKVLAACLKHGGRLDLFDRDGKPLGTFQRPEKETGNREDAEDVS